MASKPANKAKANTIDEYLAALNADQREALERLRNIIHAAAPGAEEGISYRIPAFRYNGKWLVWFGAAEKHCAIYGIDTSADELADYDTNGKGTIRFGPDNPLPATLVKKLVKARVAKIDARR
ncbi:MAG: DUF1801 domain-containing protein [Gemmatimonadota bacterium]|nr:DUF1801 domain-containing protein [Gemmatimonadota bacterium]